MNAQATNLSRGRTWTVRSRSGAAVVVATFALGVIVGRQPVLDLAGGHEEALATSGGAALTPDQGAERDALIVFRAGERSVVERDAGQAERDAMIVFRAAERAAAAAIVPATAERDALVEFRAGERISLTARQATAERDALIEFRAGERATWADGREP